MSMNKGDSELVLFCMDNEHSISDIARHLNISVKNASVRVEKLRRYGLIEVIDHGNGRAKGITTAIKGSKLGVLYLLNIIKHKGSMTEKELLNISSQDRTIPQDTLALAILALDFMPYVTKTYALTEQGKKFLEDNK